MTTADLAITALAVLNLAQCGCYHGRDRLLITNLADRVQLPKAPAAPSSSVPKKGTDAAQQPHADSTQPMSVTGGPSVGELTHAS